MIKTTVVHHGIPIQSPFLFRNVVFADFSGMLKNSLKKAFMDCDKKRRRKTERLLAQNLRDASRDLVRLIFFVLIIRPLRLRADNPKEPGHQPNLLQADSREPRVGLFPLGGLDLTDVFFKIQF